MPDTSEPTTHRRLLTRFPRAVPVLIFLLVGAITALSVFAIERSVREQERGELARRTQAIGAAIERRASTSSAFLRAGAALFTVQENVDSALFRRFVAELRLDTDYLGSEGIGWGPVLGPAQIRAFETELNRGRGTAIAVWRKPGTTTQQQMVPVQFIQPDTLRNRRALGFDMYAEQTRRRAMDEATRYMRPTATSPLMLVQDNDKSQRGFIVYMPVFTSGEDGRELKGFIYSPFNASEFLRSAAETAGHEGLGITLREADAGAGQGNLMARLDGGKKDGMTAERTVNLANRELVLVVQSGREDVLSMISMITLLFGIAVASLLMLIARLLTQQADEDRQSIDWFAQQNSIRDSLTRELNHRVKNTLANILSIVALTRRRATNLDEFAEGIDGRIRALSATHDLLTQSDWSTTPVRSVVEVELAPYARHEGHEVVLTGPDVELAPNDALSLGLALHELATNAAKFGALSVADGRVEVSWHMRSDNLAQVDWVEGQGPAVARPTKRGFGTDLLEKIVAHELRHPVELEFDPRGVRCTLLVPVRTPSEFALRKREAPAHSH